MTTITGKPGSEDSTGRLMYHLHNTARLLIPSVVADNASSVRYAHDVLCLWFNQSRFTRYWEEEYRWHSFFLTPDYLSLKETEPQWNMLLRGSKYKKRCRFVHYVCKCLIRFAVVNGGGILLLILNRKKYRLSRSCESSHYV
ncbi:hypothetical protein [Escherichia coli]|uniref:hypothetical protein n=1 Tax=Escherichia coli TaxID=562 RepID=UPI004068B67C